MCPCGGGGVSPVPFPIWVSFAGAGSRDPGDTPSAHGVPPGSLWGCSWSCAANWVRMGDRGLSARLPSPSHSCSLRNPVSPESQPGGQTDGPHSNASWEQRAGSAALFHCDCPNYRKTLISWGFSEQSKSLEGTVLIFSPQTGSRQGLILFISHVDSGQFLNLLCPAASSHGCSGRDKGEVFVGCLGGPL